VSGQILIIDALSNRRIHLRAILDTACYDVDQAESQLEGLSRIRSAVPDVVILAHDLPGLKLQQFCKALRHNPKTQFITVMVAVPRENHSARISALTAGAADVIEYMLEPDDLKARLRSFMRLRQTSKDACLATDATRTLGFAEEQRRFEKPVFVTTVANDIADIPADLLSHQRLNVTISSPQDVRRSPGTNAEVFVLFESGNPLEYRDLLGALRSNAQSCHAGLLYVAKASSKPFAPSPLDLGAHDQITASISNAELLLRIQRLAQRKRGADRARAELSTLEEKAYHDALTGLHNRRYAEDYLLKQDRPLAQRPTGLSILMVDIDHFKGINDTHGHAAGDKVLCSVASVLKSNLRDGDLVARFGGEEFLVALPNVDRHQARAVAERLRSEVASLPTSLDSGTVVRVTVSIGVALTSRSFGKPSKDLRCAADNALYRAKRKGRNQIEIATSDDFLANPVSQVWPQQGALDKSA
jgi:two-component system, cell cycle response regulator